MVMVGIPDCSGGAITLQMLECPSNTGVKVDPPKRGDVSESTSWMDLVSIKQRVYQAFSSSFVNQNRDKRDDEESPNVAGKQEDYGILPGQEELEPCEPCFKCLVANVEVTEPAPQEELILHDDDGSRKMCGAEEIEAVKEIGPGDSSHVQSDTMKETREEVEERTIPTAMKQKKSNDSAVNKVEIAGDTENKEMNRKTFVEATAEYLRMELTIYMESQMKTGKFRDASKKRKTEYLKKYLKKTLKAYIKDHRMLAHKSDKKNLQSTMDRMVTSAVDESDKSIKSEKPKKGKKEKKEFKKGKNSKEIVKAAGSVVSGERTLLCLTECEKDVDTEGKKNSKEVKNDEQDSELLLRIQSKVLESKPTSAASPNELLKNFVALEAKRLEELEQSLNQDKFNEVASQANEALQQLHEDIADSDSSLPGNIEKMDQEQVDVAIAHEVARLQKLHDEFLYKVKIAAHDCDNQSVSSRIRWEETLTIEEELARLNKQANELTSRGSTLALTMHVISREDI